VACVFASICATTGESRALIALTVNTYLLNAHLLRASGQPGPQRHSVLILDGAGWYTSHDLQVSENITLMHVPPHSPQLNPVERVWARLRDRALSNPPLPAVEELDALHAAAITGVSTQRFRSLATPSGLTRGLTAKWDSYQAA
jgi:transposase